MKYFAEIKNNKVVRVIVATQETVNKNYSGTWIETFKEKDYKKNTRKNYAGIGYTLDGDGDFISPEPIINNTNNETYLNPDSKRYIIRDKITKDPI